MKQWCKRKEGRFWLECGCVELSKYDVDIIFSPRTCYRITSWKKLDSQHFQRHPKIWVWVNNYENTIFRGINIHFNPAILMWTTGVLLVLTHPNILQTYSYPIPVQNMSQYRCRWHRMPQKSSGSSFVELEPVGRPVNVYIDVDVESPWFFSAKSSRNGWFSTSSCQFRLGYVRKSNSFGEKG